MPIIRTNIKPIDRLKAGSTIYHLHMKTASKVIPCQVGFYFGSIAAIFEAFTPEQLEISQQSIYDFGITTERPYENRICRITKAELKRKKGGRRNPKTI